MLGSDFLGYDADDKDDSKGEMTGFALERVNGVLEACFRSFLFSFLS